MSDNLLATKVHIPPLHGNLVNRANIIALLNEGIVRGCCLTLISSPALAFIRRTNRQAQAIQVHADETH